MLHDPAYRHVSTRLTCEGTFHASGTSRTISHGGRSKGSALLDMHLGFETAEPWPLDRLDQDGVTPTRAILRADKETRHVITLDEQTTLQRRSGPGVGVPTG